MAGQVSVGWPTCDEDECIGIRFDTGDKCLAHAGDEERDAALKQVAQTGKIDARGVTISSMLLKKILDSTPRNPDGHAMPTEVRFDRATFQGKAGFGKATFEGDARFAGATFKGPAWFAVKTFKGDARFNGATFEGDAEFTGATFKGLAWFDKATFKGDARFNHATFECDTGFRVATFKGAARYSRATFKGIAPFGGATFKDIAWFDKTTFEGDARFDGATFKGPAWFAVKTFEGDASFTGATFDGLARFAGATFKRDARFFRATFKGDVPVLGPVAVGGSWIWMERNSLRRSELRQTRPRLLAAGDNFWAASGLTCVVRSFVWIIRTCLFPRCSLVPPSPLAPRLGVQNSQGCFLSSGPMSQD